MPGQARPARTPAVVFDDAAWAEDMLRASTAARASLTTHPERSQREVSRPPAQGMRSEEPSWHRATALREGLPAAAGWSTQHALRNQRASRAGFACCTSRSAYGIRPAICVSRRCTRSPTDGCIPGPRSRRLRLQDLAELREHPRTPHRAAPSVRQLPDVHRAGHVRVTMAEEKRDLIDAFAREQRPTRHGVSEAMHRRQLTVSNGSGLARRVDCV